MITRRNWVLKRKVWTIMLVAAFWAVNLESGWCEPIKIGMVYPMSGAMATVTEGIIAAHKAAGAEINKKGGLLGRPVEFVMRDDNGNPELSTRYCRELIMKEKAAWVTGGFGSAVGLAAAAVAGELKSPIFVYGGGAEKITMEEWNPYMIRYRFTTAAESYACVRVLAESVLKGVKDPTIYWISWDYEYGRSLHKPFVAKLKEMIPNAKIIGEAWPRVGESDYGPFIQQMVARKPTVVINAIWGGGVVSLLKQGAGYGLWDVTKLVAMTGLGGIEYRIAIGKDMPAETWTNCYEDYVWPDNEEQRAYYRAIQEFTGKPGMNYSNGAGMYYAVKHIAKGVEKAKTLEPLKVIQAMKEIPFHTYWGEMKIRDFDHQVTSGAVWAPMVKKQGVDYLVLDASRLKYFPCDSDLYTKEEWTAARKAAGKK